MKENEYYKEEAIKVLKEKISFLRAELDFIEQDMNSNNEEEKMLSVIYSTAIFLCLDNLKEKADEIAEKSKISQIILCNKLN